MMLNEPWIEAEAVLKRYCTIRNLLPPGTAPTFEPKYTMFPIIDPYTGRIV